MNVYVMVDIEGISGIYTRSQVLPSEPRFAEGRRCMVEDVNSCVAGLKAAGVEKVYVQDCHGGSYSFLWDELSSDADYYICGSDAGERFIGLEDCDAIILLGYHAMAGTAGAVLEHSFSSVRIQNLYMNGEKVGEIAFDAAIAGEHGIPIIMVSGDDKACAEAKALLPNVTTACVKKGLDVFGAMLLPKEKAHKLIYDKTIEAVQNASNCGLFTFAKPMNCVVEVTERSVILEGTRSPYYEILDGRTYAVKGETAEEILFRAMSKF